MYRPIFNLVKKIIPKISETELIALRSGTTSLDREIFQGKVQLPVLKHINNPKSKVFFDKTEKLLNKYGDIPVYPNEKTTEIMNYLRSNQFFSFIIDDKFGGNKLPIHDISSIVTRITTMNPPLGVAVMVPNSLGPGELLAHYGTEKQKDKYLPGLANGTYVPCFGLTGPDNGSDAAGQIDEGLVEIVNGKRVITVDINKRYITLAPVANLVGLAFKLKDPDNLLEKGQEGVTLALIKGDHAGLIKATHHNPLNAGFPNGTLKGKFNIELDEIIGGEEKAGHGWKMLMEALAAGRGVCLPATALASSKAISYGLFNYTNHRKQFNIPLIKMEGVAEKYLDIIYNTWVIQSSVGLTNTLLDMGEKPAVISAIMKQQTTDRGREVINHGMDIHAGSAICLGRSNFIEKYYRGCPIGITVEGSNTLTRNLIIFGQGLNKSHPYIFPVLESIMNDDYSQFKSSFKNIISHSLKLYSKSFLPNISRTKRLESQTLDFACLSNFVALKGGAIKKEQFLSADMADIFSNLYLAHSVRWYHKQHNVSDILTDYCINRLLDENNERFNRVVNSLKQKPLLLHLRKKHQSDTYLTKRKVLSEIQNNKNIMEHIKRDVYTKDTVLEDLETLNSLDQNSQEYKDLYRKVIDVGEYDNIEM